MRVRGSCGTRERAGRQAGRGGGGGGTAGPLGLRCVPARAQAPPPPPPSLSPRLWCWQSITFSAPFTPPLHPPSIRLPPPSKELQAARGCAAQVPHVPWHTRESGRTRTEATPQTCVCLCVCVCLRVCLWVLMGSAEGPSWRDAQTTQTPQKTTTRTATEMAARGHCSCKCGAPVRHLRPLPLPLALFVSPVPSATPPPPRAVVLLRHHFPDLCSCPCSCLSPRAIRALRASVCVCVCVCVYVCVCLRARGCMYGARGSWRSGAVCSSLRFFLVRCLRAVCAPSPYVNEFLTEMGRRCRLFVGYVCVSPSHPYLHVPAAPSLSSSVCFASYTPRLPSAPLSVSPTDNSSF